VGIARCDECGDLRLLDLLARHKHACSNCIQGPLGRTH
jgi:hypothetical protein